MLNLSIQALLGNNVVELSFVRRHPKLGWANIRGLLGTTNYKLLNGDFGTFVLNFVPPKGVGMGYPYKSYNLCVVWDMFRQEYRVFGAEQVTIKRMHDVSTDEGYNAFIQYFDEAIRTMSNDDKLTFMGYTGEINTITKATNPQIKQSFMSRIINKFKPMLGRMVDFFKRNKK